MLSKTAIVTLFPIAVAFLAGAALPFQAISNGVAGRALGHPLWGAMLSLTVSGLVLLPLLWLLNVPAPRAGNVLHGPWWLWIGGVIGALYVAIAAAFAPRLGAGGFIVLVVAGQMVAAVLIDHFGLMDLPVRPINLARAVGVICILAGALFILYGGNAAENEKTVASAPHPQR